MSNIINLRVIRKQQRRADDRAIADANSAKFGEKKPLKVARQAESQRVAKLHATHKLTDD